MVEVTGADRKLLIELASRWRESHSDLRFGQWLWAVCEGDPFYVEDEDIGFKMRKWFADNKLQVD